MKSVVNLDRIEVVNLTGICTTPDFSPYDFEFPDKRVFDWDLAMKKHNKTLDWKKIQKGPDMDDAGEIRKNHYKGNK